MLYDLTVPRRLTEIRRQRRSYHPVRQDLDPSAWPVDRLGACANGASRGVRAECSRRAQLFRATCSASHHAPVHCRV